MKKIQVSTVKQTADVEVIYVNANLISKAVKASLAIKDVDESIKTYCLNKCQEPILDDEGCPVTDELTGEVKTRTVAKYRNGELIDFQIKAIHEVVAPFLKELVDAFEED